MTHDILFEMVMLSGSDTLRSCHALKVHGLAVLIAGREGYSETDRLVTSLSAALHDIAIHRCEQLYGSFSGKLQEREGPLVARPLLEKYTNDEALIARVCAIIAHHHTYTGFEDVCHQALIEADFLVNFDEGAFKRPAFEAAVRLLFKTATGKALAAAMFGTGA